MLPATPGAMFGEPVQEDSSANRRRHLRTVIRKRSPVG
jgi:hypothetical protein